MSSQPVAPETEIGVEQLFAALEAKIREFRPKDDLSAVTKAYQFAGAHHSRQKRDSGEPYMNHPLIVTQILADMKMDLVCLETGLLHDVVEDTRASVEDIRKNFGKEFGKDGRYDKGIRQAQEYMKSFMEDPKNAAKFKPTARSEPTKVR